VRRSRSASAVASLLAAVMFTLSASPSLVMAQGGAKPAKAAKGAKRKSLRDSLTGEAKASFERGITLYNTRNFEGALVEFEHAYKLTPDPRLLFNMAIADRDMQRYARAVARLQQELKEGEDTLSDDEKKTAQGVLEGLKQFTAPLTLSVNEPGAQVFIDGVDTGQTTPLAGPLTVDVGERTVTLRKPGFLETTSKVSISGGNPAKLDLKLDVAVKRGKLIVKAGGAPVATVFVDGIERGPAPWEGEVTAGAKHTVEIRAKGFVTETRTETIEFKSTSVIEVTLRPEQGKVRVESDKPENAIFIDGAQVGSGTWEGILPSGGHQLTISRDGADTYTADLAVQTDQTRTVKIALNKSGGVAWYWWVAGGVLLVGGGVTTYLLVKPKTDEPQPGTIPPNTVKVNLPW
jgi:hypothetical protein